MNSNKISQTINKKIIYFSLIYTFIFLIIEEVILYFLSEPIVNIQNFIEILKTILISTPIFFIWFYVSSGTQILLIGYILKLLYRNDMNLLLTHMSLKKNKTRILVILFSIIWIFLNYMLWESLSTGLKLG